MTEAKFDPEAEGAAVDAALNGGEGADSSVELAAEKDRNLRLRAELENVRARASRELADERKYGAMPLAKEILAVLDNIDRAIEHAEQNADAASLLEGFKLVRQQLSAILQRHDCVEIAALGEAFDPQFHQAILQQPSADVPANHVMLVTQSGFRMHDRVVRPSHVIVSSGPGVG